LQGERPINPLPVATPTTEGVAETASRLAEILDSLSPEERAILVRRAVGFSNCELEEVYGRLVDVEELVLRVVERVRSCRGALQV